MKSVNATLSMLPPAAALPSRRHCCFVPIFPLNKSSGAGKHVTAVIPAVELRCDPGGAGDSPPTHHTSRQRIDSALLGVEQK